MSIPEPTTEDLAFDVEKCYRFCAGERVSYATGERTLPKIAGLLRRVYAAESRALAAEADARRLAEEVAAVNESHYAMKGEPCTCSGCDRRRAALAAHAGTEDRT